jgi:RNA polymerase sigma factor (sigma-70 family)
MGAAVRSREQVLTELYGEATRRGYRIAYSLLGQREAAEDAVQEALARTCAAWAKLDSPGGWFYRVLINHCMAELRKRGIAKRLLPWLRPEPAPMEGPSPDQRRLLLGVAELPAKQRAAVVLRYGEEFTVKEVAAAMGIAPATAKTHITRGLEALRNRMGGGQ